MRILLVEDDRTIGSAVMAHIAAQGHAVDWARSLRSAGEFLDVTSYEMVLLDLGLPDGLGSSLLRRLRRGGTDAAVVILSAKDQIADRVAALNEGADDYLTKPFDLSELAARIAAVARRYSGQTETELAFGPLRIDPTNRVVTRGGSPVDLSAREWAVLSRLIRRPEAIVSKSDIEESLYALGAEVESNTVEVYVSRLRKKLGRDAIRTVRGLGYMVPKEPASCR